MFAALIKKKIGKGGTTIITANGSTVGGTALQQLQWIKSPITVCWRKFISLNLSLGESSCE
jgi:hypothetical protein